MRLLVLSDSHSRKERLSAILEAEPFADAVFHLGDGAADMRYLQDTDRRTFFLLRGNCDSAMAPDLQDTCEITLNDTRIFATHGHLYGVKFGLEKIGLYASLNNIKLVLFGHTHIPFIHYENGIHFFNPGSVSENTYGCVDITKNGIMCLHKDIKM